jgi:hypothetical protein
MAKVIAAVIAEPPPDPGGGRTRFPSIGHQDMERTAHPRPLANGTGSR